MLNPNRLPSGQRLFTLADVRMADKIKELLYVKGLKMEAAIDILTKTYRKYPPRKMRQCRTPQDAISLLHEVKAMTEDDHALAKIEAVEKWIDGFESLLYFAPNFYLRFQAYFFSQHPMISP